MVSRVAFRSVLPGAGFLPSFALALAGCGASPPVAAPPAVRTQKLEAALGKTGYDVRHGEFAWFSVEDCLRLHMPSCYGNNPTSPYGLLRLPALPDQPPDVGPPNWYDQPPPPMWRLRPDEAIILIGKTPPELRYFGFTPYIYDRVINGVRVDLFSSLGDTANGNIAFAGDKGPFNRDVAIVFSSSPGIDAEVRRIVAQSYPDRLVVPIHFPAAELHLGSGRDADTMIMLMRVALFAHADAGAAYLASPPFSVLRATPRTERTVETFPRPALRPRTPPNDERYLLASRDALVKAVEARLVTGAKVEIVPGGNLLPSDGFQCIANGVSCLGDNRDSPYLSIDARPFPASGTSLFIVGVNHHASLQATYASVSIYDYSQLRGVTSVVDTEFAGSTEPYIPNDPNKAKLYVHEFARDCGQRAHCTKIGVDEMAIAADRLTSFSERAYIHPELIVGAWGDQLLPPVLLVATEGAR